MSATREVVREKARVARDLIKSHPLTPEFPADFFAQKGIGAFQLSAALIEWSQSELEGLQKIWVQAYKNAWHVPWSSTNSLYTFPTTEGGHECPLPSGVLTQALLQHVDQCMRHEDVIKKIMLAQLARTLTEWHCNSFTDLIDEMELWDYKDFWSQLAKPLHSQKVSVTWAEKMDKKLASVLVPEKISWATATRSIRNFKKRIEKFMHRSMQWEAPSMPTSAYDPQAGLLREQETPLVIGQNWFLDQEIPAGGFVRIQDSSQVWEEQVDETSIITTE